MQASKGSSAGGWLLNPNTEEKQRQWVGLHQPPCGIGKSDSDHSEFFIIGTNRVVLSRGCTWDPGDLSSLHAQATAGHTQATQLDSLGVGPADQKNLKLPRGVSVWQRLRTR